MTEQPFDVTHTDGALVVRHPSMSQGEGEKWAAKAVDERRILLVPEETDLGMLHKAHAFANFSVEMLKELLGGLARSGYSGVLAVDTGYGVKKVYMSRGEIVWAASNVIDDRLGEVIYRESMISLDELTSSAAQVTKSKKFGQVLLSSGSFTNVELYKALRLQVLQILRSIFMAPRLFVEMEAGPSLAPSEVIFQDGAGQLLDECYHYGCAFRDFLGRLRAESVVSMVVLPEKVQEQFEPGTFHGDLLAMISEQNNVQALLNTSKLMDIYTIAALMSLVNLGLCSIQPIVDSEKKPAPFLAPLKAKLDAYSYVLVAVKKVFAEGGREFPTQDVITFAKSLNSETFSSLFLDAEARISRDCINGVFSQCHANANRVGYFEARLEALIQFLLLVAGDNLDRQTAQAIRQEYRAISA